MNLNFKHANSRVLEAMLVLVQLVLTYVLYQTVGYKVIVLNLFYPPVIPADFSSAGTARVCWRSSACCRRRSCSSFNLGEFAAYSSPLVVALSVLVWGGVLGLAALLVGTLSDRAGLADDRAARAHVGVVEVLSALPAERRSAASRTIRIAWRSICRDLAVQLKLGRRGRRHPRGRPALLRHGKHRDHRPRHPQSHRRPGRRAGDRADSTRSTAPSWFAR